MTTLLLCIIIALQVLTMVRQRNHFRQILVWQLGALRNPELCRGELLKRPWYQRMIGRSR